MAFDINYLFIFLLSFVPFIEARGAMFFGFASGITDITLYALCSFVNITQTFLYPLLIARFRTLFELANKSETALANLFSEKKPHPVFFLFAIPMFGNGINTFTSSIASLSLGIKGFEKYVAGGIVLRDAITYLILSGSLALAGGQLLQDLLKASMVAYAVVFLYSHRESMLKYVGLEKATAADTKCLAAAACVLAFAAMAYVFPGISFGAKTLFSYLYPATSDGKMFAFLAFFGTVLVIKAFYGPSKPSPAGAANLPALYLLIIFSLLAISVLSAYLLISPFESAANSHGYWFGMFSGQKVAYFTLGQQAFTSLTKTNSRIDHNHMLKFSAFFPLALFSLDLENKYNLGLDSGSRLPFFAVFAGFALIVAAIILAVSILSRLGIARLMVLSAVFFVNIASSIDAGPLNIHAISTLACLSIYFSFAEKNGPLRLLALCSMVLAANFLLISTRDYQPVLLQLSIGIAALLLYYKGWRLACLAAFGLAVLSGGFNPSSIAASIFLAASLFVLAKKLDTLKSCLVLVPAILLLFFLSSGLAPEYNFVVFAAYCSLAIGAGLRWKSTHALIFLLVASTLFLASFRSVKVDEMDMFHRIYENESLLIIFDSPGLFASSFNQSYEPRFEHLFGNTSAALIEKFQGGSLTSAFSAKPVPKYYQTGFVCSSPQGKRPDAKNIFLVKMDSPCGNSAGLPLRRLVFGNLSTSAEFEFNQSSGKCEILVFSKGKFSACPQLVTAALNNIYEGKKLSGVMGEVKKVRRPRTSQYDNETEGG
ncbi:hypothetical protein FJZ26_02490 [Candidatus Parvarchaeota archaeon]|nr:hypothetical protein [Candidatus Parvarchaeota archaeon]